MNANRRRTGNTAMVSVIILIHFILFLGSGTTSSVEVPKVPTVKIDQGVIERLVDSLEYQKLMADSLTADELMEISKLVFADTLKNIKMVESNAKLSYAKLSAVIKLNPPENSKGNPISLKILCSYTLSKSHYLTMRVTDVVDIDPENPSGTIWTVPSNDGDNGGIDAIRESIKKQVTSVLEKIAGAVSQRVADFS
ncbi:hypothetical protein P0082_08535 [Candidatus Haliotispira prima]|uniref:DUF302 domain-containing protein n=1 Tax=Candidatus Haliotispira prima TaxID=3034016 RepID=A0ABY8MEX8_9SPIO|nr:hypothetical protein P0082_08535 [Candidatus Haliotispira prima]